jgi:hypothetical protein
MNRLYPLFAWLICLVLDGDHLLGPHWEAAIVQFAAIALVPVALELLDLPVNRFHYNLIGAFCVAYALFPSFFAPFLALPYLIWAAWTFIRESTDILFVQKATLLAWIKIMALAYWTTGAIWAVAFLSGISILGFDPVITGLTAAHFHVAGFALTTVIYCLYRNESNRVHRILAISALAGMPMVALGITLTNFGITRVVEWISALLFALMALGVSWRQMQTALRDGSIIQVKRLWQIGAASLIAGGLLAGLYSLRFVLPLPWINIPNMKIWHGTLNAIGFAWLSLEGWRIKKGLG